MVLQKIHKFKLYAMSCGIRCQHEIWGHAEEEWIRHEDSKSSIKRSTRCGVHNNLFSINQSTLILLSVFTPDSRRQLPPSPVSEVRIPPTSECWVAAICLKRPTVLRVMVCQPNWNAYIAVDWAAWLTCDKHQHSLATSRVYPSGRLLWKLPNPRFPHL